MFNELNSALANMSFFWFTAFPDQYNVSHVGWHAEGIIAQQPALASTLQMHVLSCYIDHQMAVHG